MNHHRSRDIWKVRGCSIVWDDVQKEIDVELEQLHELLDDHRSLLDRCHRDGPDHVERSALAAVLHTFYTGIENIFVRVTVAAEGSKPTGDAWHQNLLRSMATNVASRPAVLSSDTTDTLVEYLTFRHVFRHAYTFHLRWEKMRHLVLGLDGVLRRLEADLAAFLKKVKNP